ncbi:MAG: hypothetical protein QOC92_2179 [Acidimicrobiaceae bacterium]|jgi:hypothetical protein
MNPSRSTLMTVTAVIVAPMSSQPIGSAKRGKNQ